jgi:hypothetical protein
MERRTLPASIKDVVLLRIIAVFWIIVGIVVILLSFLALASGLMQGMPAVSGAGTFKQVLLILIPLLLFLGLFVVFCGIKLFRGNSWARLCLEIITWVSILVTLAYIVASAVHDWEIARNDTITRSLVIMVLCVLPLTVILLVMRTSARK